MGEYTTIGAISEVFDGPHATPTKIETGPYFLSISSLVQGKLELDKSAHVNEVDFKKWTRRVTPEEGDVLFSYETRLGEAALMPGGIRACLGRRMGLLRPNRKKVIPAYLLYYYLAPEFQGVIRARQIDGCTVDRIALKDLPNFPIRLPSLNVQRKVVETLSRIDQKIELNRKMNATLEEMAQALFKSWFVDFDPVLDKALAAGHDIPEPLQARAERRRAQISQPTHQPLPAEVLALFPVAFAFTEELGWVPQGWGERDFDDLFNCETKSVQPNDRPDFHWTHYSIPAFDDGKLPVIHLGEEIKSNKYLVPENAVLVSKLNPSTARIWLPDTFSKDCICSTEFMPFVAKDELMRPYLYELCSSPIFYHKVCSMATGSTGSRQRVKPRDILGMKMLAVPEEAIHKFCRLVETMHEKMQKGIQSNASLAALRDTLLPKLISGELRIPDAEALAAEAGA